MKLEELIAKVQQIEEQASLTLREYPHGHTIERQRLVLAIAKQVRAHLTDQLAGGQRNALAADVSERGLRVVDRDGDRIRVAVVAEGSSGT